MYKYIYIHIQHSTTIILLPVPIFSACRSCAPPRTSRGLPGSTTAWPWTTRKVYVTWLQWRFHQEMIGF